MIKDLKSELSGKFEDLILALMVPLSVFLAKELQHAIEGIGTNEQTLIEVLCTASNAEIYAIKNAYTEGNSARETLELNALKFSERSGFVDSIWTLFGE